MLAVMRHRKAIVGAMLLILFAGLAIFGGWYSKRPVLAWKVLSIRSIGSYWIRDSMQDCWCADIEVTNLTSSEVIVDWNQDKSAFQIDGHWEDLGIGALMPYLGPHEAATVPLIVPRRAQACRLLMHYEHGPLWSRADEFLKGRGVYLSDNYFIPAMRFNKKLPGHFRRLDIEVKLPARTSKAGETKGPHNFSLHWTGSSRFSLVSMEAALAAAPGQ
jgi:hypothetical protein